MSAYFSLCSFYRYIYVEEFSKALSHYITNRWQSTEQN